MRPFRSTVESDEYIEKREMSTTKSYDEFLDFLAAGITPDALLAFRPSHEATQRVEELVAKSESGTISTEEESELDDTCSSNTLLSWPKPAPASTLEQ